MNELYLYHGGVPGLPIGGIIQPGHSRKPVDGCPWCLARSRGEAGPRGIDPLPEHADRVYLTPHRLYAKHYASLWGYGDLYRVEPVGEPELSTEDSIETWHAPGARVVNVYERAVLLTMSERRRLYREWGAADRVRGWAA
jgi:hypothetical protein